jgi:hypothetical protein
MSAVSSSAPINLNTTDKVSSGAVLIPALADAAVNPPLISYNFPIVGGIVNPFDYLAAFATNAVSTVVPAAAGAVLADKAYEMATGAKAGDPTTPTRAVFRAVGGVAGLSLRYAAKLFT